MNAIQTAIRIRDRILIEVDPAIAKAANIKNGTLFEEQLTEEGILLKRADLEENEKEDAGASAANRTPTPARQTGGAKG